MNYRFLKFFLYANLILSFIHGEKSHAIEVTVYPKDLVLFRDAELRNIEELLPKSLSILQRNQKKDEVLGAIAQHRAYSVCRKSQCGGSSCKDVLDFEVSQYNSLPQSSRMLRTHISLAEQKIELFPEYEAQVGKGNDRPHDRQEKGYLLASVVCSDHVKHAELAALNPFEVRTILADEVTFMTPEVAHSPPECHFQEGTHPLASTVLAEAKDWASIAYAMGAGSSTVAAEMYANFKDSMKYCPKESVELCLYRGLSLVSFGLSSWANEQAKRASDTVKMKTLTKGSGESHPTRVQRLEALYSEKKQSFSPDDQKAIDALFATIPSKLSYDHNGSLPKLLEDIEAVLNLPKEPKPIDPKKEGEGLRATLMRQGYSVEFVDRAYRVAALMHVGIHHNTFIPLRPIYVKGEPGVGKTHFIEQIAKALGLPLCNIKVKKAENATEELLGSLYSRDANGSSAGLIAECFIHQRDADGNLVQKRVSNPILFFDELDRVLNAQAAGPLRATLLSLFNNSAQDRSIHAPGLQNISIDLSKSPIFIGANGDIEKMMDPMHGMGMPVLGGSTTAKKEVDPAFRSRMDYLEMGPIDELRKKGIADSIKKEAMNAFALQALDPDLEQAHDDLVKSDKSPGIREIKSLIYENIAIQAARNLGWKLEPIPSPQSKSPEEDYDLR